MSCFCFLDFLAFAFAVAFGDERNPSLLFHLDSMLCMQERGPWFLFGAVSSIAGFCSFLFCLYVFTFL